MKPLQAIGLGLLVVGVKVTFGRWDVLVDPVGWLIVLLGLRALLRARDFPMAITLTYAGSLALLCSVPLWWPDTAERLEHGTPAGQWAVGLAELLFQAALCHALAERAKPAGAGTAVAWFRVCEAGLLIGAVAPVLYFAADQTWLQSVGDWGMLLQPVVFILCFCYSGKQWAGAPTRPITAVAAAGDTDG